MTQDTLDELAGIEAGSALDALRRSRPVTREHVAGSYAALFERDTADAPRPERLAVAVFVAGLHRDPVAVAFYRSALLAAGGAADLADALAAEADRSAATGPWGAFPSAALAAWDAPGPEYAARDVAARTLGPRLTAALGFAHYLVLHPRDAERGRLTPLQDAGWTTTGIVTLAQEIAYLAFQLRVAEGLRVLGGGAAGVGPAPAAAGELTAHTVPDDGVARPDRFTTAQLDWLPWLEPERIENLTDAGWEALVDRARAKSEYFMLLVRDPEILRERTLTDKDVFHNVAQGLPRAERELTAAATSRFNGCIYCASVHSRFAAHFSKRGDDVQRLLDEGVAGRQEPRWRAIVDAAAHLAATPTAFSAADVTALRAVGLGDAEIYDVVHAGAFFAWANRLMLTLGEPAIPA